MIDKLNELVENKPRRGFPYFFGRIRNQGLIWNKKRVKRLRGWIKWAKRGFTRVVCPPLLEDIVIELAREQCALGDQHVPDINGPWRRS